MRVNMQQHHCNGLIFLVIWLLLFLVKVNCYCSINYPILTCEKTNTDDLNLYLKRQYSVPSIMRIRESSVNKLDSAKFRNVLQLELEHNNIGTILPGYFQSFINIQNLSLAHNNISHIIEGVFREMASLHTINLSHNQIKQLNSHTFIGLVKLTDIDLSFNHLKQLPDNIFSYQARIKRLNVAHNNFTSILNATAIDKLNVSFNQIERINATYNFQCLDVSFNNITEIDVNAFSEASRLEELYLQHNSLSTIPSNAFMNMINLTILDLSYNRFSLYQIGPSNDWLHIFSPRSLKMVLIDHNLWFCETLRDILTNLQSRNINTGSRTSHVDNSSVLGIECHNSYYQTDIQTNDSIASKIFDKIEYLQKTILQLTKDSQSNISNLQDKILQINNNVLQVAETTSIVDKNLTNISSLLKICNGSESNNFKECLVELIENIQEPELSEINSKLNRMFKEKFKQQDQDQTGVAQPHTTISTAFIVITDILLILILFSIMSIIYLIRKNNFKYNNKEQISLM